MPRKVKKLQSYQIEKDLIDEEIEGEDEKGNKTVKKKTLAEIARGFPSRPWLRTEKALARHLYIFEGYSPVEIAMVTHHNYSQVTNLVYASGWRKIKGKIDAEIQKRFTDSCAEKLENVVGLTTEVIEKYFITLLKTDNIGKITMKDAKLASDIMANYHRVVQLAKNKPTSIAQNFAQMSEKELVEAAAQLALDKMEEDPMYNGDASNDAEGTDGQIH